MWSSSASDMKTAKKRRRNDSSSKKPPDPDNVQEPRTIDELATHSRKITEVRNWLSSAVGTPQMLLITGPAGSGKTVTMKVVAKSLGLEVQEWINPMEKLEFDFNDWIDDTYDSKYYIEPRQMEKFEGFIFRSSRFSTILARSSRSVILIEDFPNYVIWKPSQLQDLLCKYKTMGHCPIVFICTDDEKLNLSYKLFPNDLRCSLVIANIRFNPVSHSAMMKLLKGYGSEFPKHHLEEVAKNANGDIRAALSSLQFSRTSSDSATVSKDVTTDFYKVLGRILYPKRLEEPSNTGKEFLYDIRNISEHYTSSFLGMLHENFLGTFSSVKNIIKGCEIFSDCDILDSGGEELTPYVSLICTAGLMCANKEPKKGSFKPLVKSRFARLCKEAQNTRYSQFGKTSRVLNLDLIPYLAVLPRFATVISSFDSDRLRSVTYGRRLVKSDMFKIPFPVKSECGEDDCDLLIEEFDD